MMPTVGELMSIVEEALNNGAPSGYHLAMLEAPTNNAGAAFRSAYFLATGHHESGSPELLEAAQDVFARVDAATSAGFAEAAQDKWDHYYTDPLPDPKGQASIKAILNAATAKLRAHGATQSAAAVQAVVAKPTPETADPISEALQTSREAQDSWQEFMTKLTAIWGGAVSFLAVISVIAFLIFLYVLIRTYIPKLN